MLLGKGLVRRSALSLLASLALYAGACSSDPEGPEPELTDGPDLEGVVYLGETNDEGLEVLLGSKSVAGDPPVISAPADGAVLESKTTFVYQHGVSARLETPAAAPRRRVFSLGELFGPERAAHAHGLPMNGAAFLLTFSTKEVPNLLRVFTDETSYEPADEAWTVLASAGDVTLTIRMGVFEEGRLPNGAGPFDGAPLHFSVGGS